MLRLVHVSDNCTSKNEPSQPTPSVPSILRSPDNCASVDLPRSLSFLSGSSTVSCFSLIKCKMFPLIRESSKGGVTFTVHRVKVQGGERYRFSATALNSIVLKAGGIADGRIEE